jgi:hypothetical protein
MNTGQKLAGWCINGFLVLVGTGTLYWYSLDPQANKSFLPVGLAVIFSPLIIMLVMWWYKRRSPNAQQVEDLMERLPTFHLVRCFGCWLLVLSFSLTLGIFPIGLNNWVILSLSISGLVVGFILLWWGNIKLAQARLFSQQHPALYSERAEKCEKKAYHASFRFALIAAALLFLTPVLFGFEFTAKSAVVGLLVSVVLFFVTYLTWLERKT